MTSKEVKPRVECPECNKIFKSKQAVISHQKYKHPNATSFHPIHEKVAALPPHGESGEAEKAVLLAEIDALKKQVGEKPAPILKSPKPEPTYYQQPDKPKPPWLIKDAQPTKKAQLTDFPPQDQSKIKGMVQVMAGAKPARQPIEYGVTQTNMMGGQTMTRIEYLMGSWMDVYKEDLLVRTIPFIWQQDKETKQNWAICLEQQFYGRKIGFMQINYPLLITPFNKSRKYVDYYGKGFKIAVDEVSQLQIPMHELDSDEKLQARLEDNAYNSQNMALYRELIIHAKKKWNWTLIIIIILILVALGVTGYYIYTHPNFLKGFSSSLILVR